MAKINLKSPELYINRELSWLEFNDRVLREGLNGELPLLERLKFLAIVSANLDEFFMIRVAGLMQQRSAKVRKRDIAGMTPTQQLQAISARVHRMFAEQSAGIRQVLGKLAEHGLCVFEPRDWSPEQRAFLSGLFTRELHPVLTPMALEDLDPQPLLPGLQLHVALQLLVETERGRLVVSGDCVYSRMQLTGRNNDGVYMPLNNATGSVWEQLKTIDRINSEIRGDLDRLVVLHDSDRWEGLPIVKEVDGFRIVRAG